MNKFYIFLNSISIARSTSRAKCPWLKILISKSNIQKISPILYFSTHLQHIKRCLQLTTSVSSIMKWCPLQVFSSPFLYHQLESPLRSSSAASSQKLWGATRLFGSLFLGPLASNVKRETEESLSPIDKVHLICFQLCDMCKVLAPNLSKVYPSDGGAKKRCSQTMLSGGMGCRAGWGAYLHIQWRTSSGKTSVLPLS